MRTGSDVKNTGAAPLPPPPALEMVESIVVLSAFRLNVARP